MRSEEYEDKDKEKEENVHNSEKNEDSEHIYIKERIRIWKCIKFCLKKEIFQKLNFVLNEVI